MKLLYAIALTASLVAVGCVGDSEPVADSDSDAGSTGTAIPQSCVPGQSISCSCPDGSPGAQTCEPDGSSYGDCMCAGSDSGPGTTSATSTSGAPDSSGTGDGSDDGGSTGAPTGFDCDTDTVSFQTDVVPIFYASCGAGTMGCHTREVFGASLEAGCRGWVSLENAAIGSLFYGGPDEGQPTGCPDMPLYERLTELVPWHCTPDDPPAIVSGDPSSSYIWRKISGGPFCDEDGPMPPPESEFTLPETDAELIRCWIEQGAPNN